MIEIIDHAGVVLVHTIDQVGHEEWYLLERHPAPPHGGETDETLIDVNNSLTQYTREALRERGVNVVGARAARPQRYAPECLSQAMADA